MSLWGIVLLQIGRLLSWAPDAQINSMHVTCEAIVINVRLPEQHRCVFNRTDSFTIHWAGVSWIEKGKL